ncbi:MAG: hypothetical protein KU37_09990 [Sulfuricurvum sp. PC08-66]|nr:MAG: hypothetical protein KU37_09990 [Sulfuricurvum sp. PC08-66]
MCRELAHIDSVAQTVLSHISRGVLILQGDLAAGKTTLVKAIAKALGLGESVTSPTFSVQQNYANRLYHYDIYNQGLEQFMAMGLFEELERDALHCIEWGDARLQNLLERAGIAVEVLYITKEPNRRCYRMGEDA